MSSQFPHQIHRSRRGFNVFYKN